MNSTKAWNVIANCLKILLGLYIIFSILSFLETNHENLALTRNTNTKTAVVYALPTFHDEVVSVMACLLHSLGYTVVVYIGNGYHVGGTFVPFSGRRKRFSAAFYGECVSQWVTIRPLMKIITDADILIFATYPMLYNHRQDDIYARNYLEKLHAVNAKTAVVYIVHRINEIVHPQMLEYNQFRSRTQSTYLVLGEHTYIEAKKQIQTQIDKVGEGIQLEYLYPVLPIDFIKTMYPGESYLLNDQSSSSSSSSSSTSSSSSSSISGSKMSSLSEEYIKNLYYNPKAPTFALQGNFGGKHTHRKNPRGVLDCLRSLEKQIRCPLKRHLYNITYETNIQSSKYVHVQSNTITTQSTLRRHSNDTIHDSRLLLSNELITPSSSSSSLSSYTHQLKCRPSDGLFHINVDLIGAVSNYHELQLGILQTGGIRVLSGLPHTQYYEAISRVKYMLLGFAEKDYYNLRATSSVPAALISRVPLVAQKDFLNIYPCLREAPMHQYVSRDTECASIEIALSLNNKQYQQMKNEIINCSQVFWKQGQLVLQKIISRSMT